MNYSIQVDGEELKIDKTELETIDIIKLADDKFHVLHENQK